MIHHNDQIEAPEARTFFHALFHKLGAQELIELRFKLPNARHMQREFFVDTEGAMRLAIHLGQSHDMYVGVAPRLGRVGTKDGVKRLFSIWGDLDAKGEHTSETRLEQLRGSPALPPCWCGLGVDTTLIGC